MLNENALLIVKVKTMRRLLKCGIKGSTPDSIINDLIDCYNYYSDQCDKKK